jgi:hypothetical protein
MPRVAGLTQGLTAGPGRLSEFRRPGARGAGQRANFVNDKSQFLPVTDTVRPWTEQMAGRLKGGGAANGPPEDSRGGLPPPRAITVNESLATSAMEAGPPLHWRFPMAAEWGHRGGRSCEGRRESHWGSDGWASDSIDWHECRGGVEGQGYSLGNQLYWNLPNGREDRQQCSAKRARYLEAGTPTWTLASFDLPRRRAKRRLPTSSDERRARKRQADCAGPGISPLFEPSRRFSHSPTWCCRSGGEMPWPEKSGTAMSSSSRLHPAADDPACGPCGGIGGRRLVWLSMPCRCGPPNVRGLL